MGESSTASTNHASTLHIARIDSVWPSKPIMITTLAAIKPAPTKTSAAFHRQIRSTRCPSGTFRAQGKPAQKPRAARNSADSPNRSLTKNVPTIAVSPEMPAAT